MAFLLRLIQVLVMFLVFAGMTVVIWYVFTWIAIAVLEAVGLSNSMAGEWLKSKLPKRKRKKSK